MKTGSVEGRSGDLIDLRNHFRDRCLVLARDRDDGSEALVTRWFASGTDDPSRSPAGVIGSAPRSARAPDRPAHDGRPTRLLIAPGLLGDTVRGLVGPLMCAREGLRAEGRDIEIVWLNGRAGCTRNAARLRTVVLEAADGVGAPIDLVGYSKGCADALHMLGEWPDTHAALRSLVSLGGVVLGTPLARQAPSLVARTLSRLPLPGLERGDGRAVHDLTPAWRRRWLEEHPLPSGIRYASLVGAPSASRVSRVLKAHWHVLARHHPYNDSHLDVDDAVLPGSELLATLDADHWALALPIAERNALLGRWFVTGNAFPRTVMLEALMDHLASPPPGGTPATVRTAAPVVPGV